VQSSVAGPLRLSGGGKKKMVATLSDLKKDDAGGSDMPAGAMQGMVDGEKLSKEFMGELTSRCEGPRSASTRGCA
jgi:hypothetical protein